MDFLLILLMISALLKLRYYETLNLLNILYQAIFIEPLSLLILNVSFNLR